MAPRAEKDSEDDAYRERVRSSSLSELEDMYTHVDKGEYPDRARKLREEIDKRLTVLEGRPERPTPHSPVPAGVIRRLWASLIDLFIHLLILGALFLTGWSASLLVSGPGTDGQSPAAVSARRGPTPLQGFVSGLLAGDAAAWKNGEQWSRVGLVALLFLILKAMMVVPAWGRSGDTPGMREAGIRIVRRDRRTRGCEAGAGAILCTVPAVLADAGNQQPLDDPGQEEAGASRQADGHVCGSGIPHLGEAQRRPGLRLAEYGPTNSGCLLPPVLLYCANSSAGPAPCCRTHLPPWRHFPVLSNLRAFIRRPRVESPLRAGARFLRRIRETFA